MTVNANEIDRLCREKEQDLLNQYYGNLAKEAAYEQPETIGDYTPNLPLQIEAEYKTFLEGLWKEYAPDDLKGTPLVLEEQKPRDIVTQDDRELVAQAHQKATTQTLWERLTKSNHKDVTHYKYLLKEYTRELLATMRLDFMEEITGHHIAGKTFENE